MKNLNFNKYTVIFSITDLFAILISFVFSFLLISSASNLNITVLYQLCKFAVVTGTINIIMHLFFNAYSHPWSKASVLDYLHSAFCAFISFVFSTAIIFLMLRYHIPIRLFILSTIFGTLIILTTRISVKYIKYIENYAILKLRKTIHKKVLIIGAGSAAKILIEDILIKQTHNYEIVGFIDDNVVTNGTVFMGFKILGTRADIPKIVKDYFVDTIIFAIPSASNKTISEILEYCTETGCEIKMVPHINDLINVGENGLFSQARRVEFNDLLSRDPISLDNSLISDVLNNKTVFVTGGGGSIGSELCRQIAKFSPKKLVIIDIYENTTYETQLELQRNYPELDLDIVIASICDKDRMDIIFNNYKPDVIYHAAAHKHVPLMEFNPAEAISNNIFGTYIIASLADKYNAEKFVMVSTDKAVNPTNVMGATKRFCEMIVQSINIESKTEFACVRFGNVLGSHGSVIPLFKKQIEKGGPVTVTHKDVTRFFMTIPEAAQLILQASSFAKNGEVFVLDMGEPVKIYDMALKYIKLSGYTPGVDIDVEIIGLRPGEKLYEELLMSEEGLLKTNNKSIFIGKNTFSDLKTINHYLKEFNAIINSDNKDDLVKLLHEAVPTFIDSDKFNNLVTL